MQTLKVELLTMGEIGRYEARQIRLHSHTKYDRPVHGTGGKTGREYMQAVRAVTSGRERRGDFYFHLKFCAFLALYNRHILLFF